jgi:hypothetical protein
MTTLSPIQVAPRPTRTSPTTTPYHVFDGLLTRSRTKKLQHKVNALLCETHYNISENYILPNLYALLLLRFTKEDDMNTQRVDHREEPSSGQSSVTEPSDRISHNFWFPKAMKAHEDLLEILSSLVSRWSGFNWFGFSNVEIRPD